MPTEENADATGGRVTRSLRKRLTSISSDTSSRPGTPVISNLLSIPETGTPLKRTTRRASLNTPLATPSKAKGRLESIDSPARRTTRRRSVSIIEQEENAIHTKSKEPSILAVEEEEVIEKTPQTTNRRVTRSSSKSPQEVTLKLSPSKAKQSEIMVQADTLKHLENEKFEENLDQPEKSISSMALSKASPKAKSEEKKSKKKVKDQSVDKHSTPLAALEKNKPVQSPAKTPVKPQSTKKVDEPNTNLDSSQKESSKKNRASVALFSSTQNSPRGKKNLSSDVLSSPKTQPEHDSSLNKKSIPEKLKNVVFNDTAEEDTIRRVFPKTPGLTKSKSYILDSSKDFEHEKSTKFDNQEVSIITSENKSDNVVDEQEDHDVLSAKTPYKLKMKAVESSTPIQSASPKRNKTIEKEDKRKNSPNENNKENSLIATFPKSWSHSVSGKVNEKVKIDSIESEETLRKKIEEDEALKKSQNLSLQNTSKDGSRGQAFDDSDDDDDNDDMLEEDEDNEDLGEEEEENDREKTIFIDDEAMEVADGEESMDSEERAYLEENEIPEYGESIGSEDTEYDESEDDADEEDEAFIVSDSEDVHVKSIPKDKTEKGKKYKRILRRVSDSSADDAAKNNANKLEQNNDADEIAIGVANPDKRKSLTVENDEAEANEENKTNNSGLKAGNKNLFKNLSATAQADISGVELIEADEIQPKKSLNRSKSEIQESDDERDNNCHEAAALEEPKRSSMSQEVQSPAKSAKRKSTNQTADEKLSHLNQQTSVSESIESLNNDLNKSKRKSASAIEIDSGQNDSNNEDAENNLHQNVISKSPKRSLISFEVQSPARSAGRKSKNQTPKEKLKEDQTTSKKKSSLKTVEIGSDQTESKASDDDEDVNCHESVSSQTPKRASIIREVQSPAKSAKRKSTNQTSNKDLKQDQTRKSLIRTSTEEATNQEEGQQSQINRSLNKSKLEKTVLSFEEGDDQEETLSASEVPSRGSLNSSRRKSISLNQSKLSIEMDEQMESDFQKPLSNSMNHGIMLRVESSPEVSASEDAEEPEPESGDDNEDDEVCFSSTELEDNQKNPAEHSTVFEFLGEVDASANANLSRRRSTVNKSKLDETFELEAGNSYSMRDNLHRSIMRKSLNQSQIRKTNESDEENEDGSVKSNDSDEEINTQKKVITKQGLSVSLNNIEFKKKKVKGEDQKIHNSFTIGVSVRASPSSKKARSSSSSSSSSSKESDNDDVLSEQEELEKVQHIQRVGPYKSRKSMSASFKVSTQDPVDNEQQKRIKRTSLYMQEQSASQSFVENITEAKKKAESKRKRNSNSFCAVIATSNDEDQEPKVKKEEEQQPVKSNDKTNIKRILSRCDEILEAANQAKLNAKLNAKKNKVKKPKGTEKREKAAPVEDEVKIPLVSKKELKRKEKIKKELAKAIKHSTAMLSTIDPNLTKKLKLNKEPKPEQTNNNITSSKRLPTEFLSALEDAPPKEKKKKSKEIESTPPSDKENSKKSSNKIASTNSAPGTLGEKKKKKPSREVIETKAGTVVVEPSTPVKLRYQNGFRESPKTPAGFKIEDIHSAGRSDKEKARKHTRQLFVEEDVSLYASNGSSKKKKSNKRKLHIEEPLYSLPKTQWTSSGVFVEEDLYSTARPLSTSTSTQFIVSSLQGSKKAKVSPNVISATTLNSALRFKQSALFNENVKRESSRDLIYRKQRKIVNKQ